MSADKPKDAELQVLRMQFQQLGRDAVNGGFKPPIMIVCIANTSFDVRIKMDTKTQGGELSVIEENWTVSHIPSHIVVRITDADGKTKEVTATKPKSGHTSGNR